MTGDDGLAMVGLEARGALLGTSPGMTARGLDEPGFTIDGIKRGDRPKRESRGAPLGLAAAAEARGLATRGMKAAGRALPRLMEPGLTIGELILVLRGFVMAGMVPGFKIPGM